MSDRRGINELDMVILDEPYDTDCYCRQPAQYGHVGLCAATPIWAQIVRELVNPRLALAVLSQQTEALAAIPIDINATPITVIAHPSGRYSTDQHGHKWWHVVPYREDAPGSLQIAASLWLPGDPVPLREPTYVLNVDPVDRRPGITVDAIELLTGLSGADVGPYIVEDDCPDCRDRQLIVAKACAATPRRTPRVYCERHANA